MAQYLNNIATKKEVLWAEYFCFCLYRRTLKMPYREEDIVTES